MLTDRFWVQTDARCCEVVRCERTQPPGARRPPREYSQNHEKRSLRGETRHPPYAFPWLHNTRIPLAGAKVVDRGSLSFSTGTLRAGRHGHTAGFSLLTSHLLHRSGFGGPFQAHGLRRSALCVSRIGQNTVAKGFGGPFQAHGLRRSALPRLISLSVRKTERPTRGLLLVGRGSSLPSKPSL